MDNNSLQSIKKLYDEGGNVISYLKKSNKAKNTDNIIAISYDLQSGSYIKYVKEQKSYIKKYTQAIANEINSLNTNYTSILEVGVGEATTLANLISKLNNKPKNIYGFDIAWSRIRYAIAYCKKKRINNPYLFTGDLFQIPLEDESIDIVYTSHSIEPNGGREKEALLEIARVARKYIVLLEPAYEFASSKAKQRMKNNGYITKLYTVAKSLGFKIIEHRLFELSNNPLNPTGLIIIKKEPTNNKIVTKSFMCPITKTSLELIKGSFFTKQGLLVYPIVDKVPCLLKENAIIATHYTDKFNEL